MTPIKSGVALRCGSGAARSRLAQATLELHGGEGAREPPRREGEPRSKHADKKMMQVIQVLPSE
jgi:hypothetical protein